METVLKILLLQETNIMKFKELFSTKDTQTLINLAEYVDIIMKKFSAMKQVMYMFIV